MEEEIKQIKNMLRAVLMSSKEGVPAHILQRDYREITQEPLPFRKLGFNNLDDFIGSMPDVVTIRRNKAGEIMYHAVANEETKHIQNLVSKQRSAKKRRNIKPARRKPKLPVHTRPPPKPRSNITPTKVPSHYYHGMSYVSPPYGGSPMEPKNIQIVVNRGDNQRSVLKSGMGRAFYGALDAANKDANKERQQSRTYELPPRFQRQKAAQLQPTPQVQSSRRSPLLPTPNRPSPVKISRPPSHQNPRREKLQVETVLDGEKYFQIVTKYLESKYAQPIKFETIPSKMDRNNYYASSAKIDGNVYGSGDIFGTSKDAEYAVCRNICEQLNLLHLGEEGTQSSHKSSLSERELKLRVKEILSEKTNGLWSTRLPVVYKEIYNEEAPSDIVNLVRKWKDIARVERVEITGRDIIYPVTEDPDKNRDLKIPLGDPLPLMEEVTVYITFINSCGHFCVQREDSPLEEINAELEKISKGTHVPSLEYLIEGCHCAAMFIEDESWSRAEILSSENKSKNELRVMFLDYGNTETCDPKCTRWLTEKAASYPTQSINCYLRGIYYLDGEENWSEESTLKFAEIVGDQQKLIAITHTCEEDDFCEVDLFLESDPSVSVNQKLIDAGLVKNLFTEDLSEDGTGYIILDIEPDPLMFPSDNQWDVYVSYVDASTDAIMMRLVGDEYSDKLDKLEVLLEKAFHEAPEEEALEIGMVCVALVDIVYHRVRVLEITEKWIYCHFLDHGDTDKMLKDQLRILDPKINTSLPYQAFPASLYGLEDVAQNSAAIEKLYDLALGNTCVAEIVSRDDGLSVILYDTSGDDDININDIILKTVSIEAESSLFVSSQGVSPAGSVSSIPDKIKSDSAKSSKESSPLFPRKTVVSPKPVTSQNVSPKPSVSSESKSAVSPRQSLSSGSSPIVTSKTITPPKKEKVSDKNIKKSSPVIQKPTESDEEGSWETESEEEVSEDEILDHSAEKIDYNSNVKRSSIDEICNSIDIHCKEIIENSPPDVKTLYTWKKSSDDKDVLSVLEEEKLWDPKEYHKLTVPPVYALPPVGHYCDIHVCFAFDPTNFVCNPYETVTELHELLKDMCEYFDRVSPQKELLESDIKIGHLYAGFQDGIWYRVIVNSIINAGLVSVYNIDFGEYNAMTLDEIRPLPLKYWKLPQQAFKGRLIEIQPAGGAQVWSEAAKYKMSQMAQDKNLVGLVCGVDESGVVDLKLVDTSSEKEDICLHEVLLDIGFAEPKSTTHPHVSQH